jgi:predicted DNA-binding transcriptional regulator YafY
MYDPIMRVLTVLEILQARDHVKGSELAARLEVNLRTVQRYIARLQDLCVPVESVRGADGFYRLKPGFHLPPLMFTDEEVFAVALGLRGLRHFGLSAFAPATEGASAKLARVLPQPLRESIQMVEEVVAVEPGPWVASTSAESLIRVSTAIRGRRRLTFGYQSHAGASSRRTIEPYGVVHTDGRWYVAGRCLLRQDLRTFRLDRISQPEIGEESFEPAAGFDIKAYLNKGMPFVQSTFAIEVWVDLPAAETRSHFGLHRVSMCEEHGGTTLRCGRDKLDVFAAMLLSLGCKIVVREPAELRQAFATLAKRASAAARATRVQVSARADTSSCDTSS